MKIVVAEKIASSAVDLLKQHAGWTVITPDQITGNLPELLKDADALIVRSAVDVGEELLSHADKLRVIGRAGVGVDNVDLHAATKKGIAVMNTPGGNAVAVAEQTLGMMISLARFLPKADRLMHEGKWEKKSLQGTELRGKTLGIVGLGRIGMEVARRAIAFQMTVIAHDPFITAAAVEDLGIKLMSLDDVFAKADYLTLHLGVTPQTIGLVNAERLAKTKKGVRLVNCARGELVDEAALLEALKSGQVAAAALDVFREEPAKNSPFAALDNVVLTPHTGGSTKEAQDAVGVQIAQQVVEYLTKGVFQNAVNVPSVSYEEYLLMQPYIVLAERLGAFAAHVLRSDQVKEIAIRYGGRIGAWKTDLVRNAAVMGVLNQVHANIVNATSLAESRGIRISETGKAQKDNGPSDMLTLTLQTSAGEQVVRGTVLHGSSPRLLSVDGIEIETLLEGHLVFMRNLDVPGVIGQVGTILGKNKVNIADFSLGRSEQSGEPRQALAVVRVDGQVPEPVLQELRKAAGVQDVRTMHLPAAPKAQAADAK